MQSRFFHSVSRFFEAAGRAISTPSGDQRGHLRVPVGSMYDGDTASRIMGR